MLVLSKYAFVWTSSHLGSYLITGFLIWKWNALCFSETSVTIYWSIKRKVLDYVIDCLLIPLLELKFRKIVTPRILRWADYVSRRDSEDEVRKFW
jgi:hypothetical protein